MVVLSAGHRLAHRTAVCMADIHDELSIVDPAFSGDLLSSTTAAGRPLRSVKTGPLGQWVKVIAAGQAVGISTAPAAPLLKASGLVCLPLEGVEPSCIVMAWRQLNTHPFAARFVAAVTRWRRLSSDIDRVGSLSATVRSPGYVVQRCSDRTFSNAVRLPANTPSDRG